MNNFVLIMVLLIDGTREVSITTIQQEFSTRPQCEQAREWIVKNLSTRDVEIASQGCFKK